MKSGKASVGYVFGGSKTLDALVTGCMFCKQNFNQTFSGDKWFECLSAPSLERILRISTEGCCKSAIKGKQ